MPSTPEPKQRPGPVAAAPPAAETRPRVLEAGCGRHIHADDLPDRRHIVGLDVSPTALDANPDLDERIVGDLQTYPLPPASFDLAICWDVLEHLRRPDRALANLTRCLKPGGKLILGMPNLLTPKALLTKFTPHRFHVFVYRRVLHFPHAGEPDHGPFPTHLRWSLRPKAIAAFARREGLHIDELSCYQSPALASVYDRYPRLAALMVALWKPLFAGADPRETELRIVLRKPSTGPAAADA